MKTGKVVGMELFVSTKDAWTDGKPHFYVRVLRQLDAPWTSSNGTKTELLFNSKSFYSCISNASVRRVLRVTEALAERVMLDR